MFEQKSDDFSRLATTTDSRGEAFDCDSSRRRSRHDHHERAAVFRKRTAFAESRKLIHTTRETLKIDHSSFKTPKFNALQLLCGVQTGKRSVDSTQNFRCEARRDYVIAHHVDAIHAEVWLALAEVVHEHARKRGRRDVKGTERRLAYVVDADLEHLLWLDDALAPEVTASTRAPHVTELCARSL